MKFNLFIVFFVFFTHIFCQELREYDLIPYNKDLKFKVLEGNVMLEKDESLQALILVMKNLQLDQAKKAIENNPQLQEIKIIYGNQDFLDFVSDQKIPHLTGLFLIEFQDSLLEIPTFQQLNHLAIRSSEINVLKMDHSSWDYLEILEINAPKLKVWKSIKSFPQLSLIDLNAPILNEFPIENMPKIYQFSYYCSFHKLPANLCNYPDLIHISFSNFVPVEIEKCLKQKIRKAYYSNITLFEGENGKIVFELLSKDRE